MPTPIKYTLQNGETRWKIRYRTASNKSTDKGGFARKKDAEDWYAETVLAKKSGRFTTVTQQKTKVGELIERHLSREVGLAPSTIANRRSIGATWVTPYWQGWAVGSISKPDVEDWIERMVKDGAGADTVAKAHGILSASLKAALERGLIVANPAVGVRRPRPEIMPNVYLTHAQVAELAEEIDTRSKTVIGLLAYTGMRFGELSALRVGSVDLRTRKISVTRSSTSVNGKLVEGPTKSHEKRDLYFPTFLTGALRERIAGRGKEELLFTAGRGGQLRLDDWRERTFYAAIDRINSRLRTQADASGTQFHPFPNVSPHDLRHTAASLAVSAGANVLALQRMLGHASASMTLDRYADLFEDDLIKVSDALEKQASAHTNLDIWSAD